MLFVYVENLDIINELVEVFWKLSIWSNDSRVNN